MKFEEFMKGLIAIGATGVALALLGWGAIIFAVMLQLVFAIG